ncbi:MAG: hypothetical protein QXO62_06635 [Thermoproteota archaeon]
MTFTKLYDGEKMKKTHEEEKRFVVKAVFSIRKEGVAIRFVNKKLYDELCKYFEKHACYSTVNAMKLDSLDSLCVIINDATVCFDLAEKLNKKR